MKRSRIILLTILWLGHSSSIKAEVVLNAQQLDSIYAGDFETELNDDITTQASAVVSQKNIGVIDSLSGEASNNEIINANRARVRNEGNSAVASQANIGVISHHGTGEARNNDIRNTNTLTVNNRVTEPADSSVDIQTTVSADDNLISSLLSSDASAVASQSNMGVMVAESGELNNTDIRNTNRATVRNRGDSAVAMQTNIGAILHLGTGTARNNDIRNTNTANVRNIAEGEPGSAEVMMSSGDDLAASSILLAERSALTSQVNIGAVLTLGILTNTDIVNRNRATVRNRGDSAVAIQENIGVAVSMGEGENNNNDINNRNLANVNNRVTDSSGFVLGITDANTDPLADTGMDIMAERSAVSGQSNIGMVMAQGTLRNTDIINNNRARVRNRGDSAVAMQSNIGIIAGLGAGTNRNNDIRNTNVATVNNRITDTTGSVNGFLDAAGNTDSDTNLLFSTVASNQSSVAAQSNIAAIIGAGNLINSTVRNSNSGRVSNRF